jgi:signal peptidase I
VTATQPEQRPANPPQGDQAEPAARKRHRRRRALIEWVVIIAVAIAAALLIKTFVLESYYIPSASMVPTLKVGNRILVDKLSYDFHGVHRGDLVVFGRPPRDVGEPGITDLVKRIIGLPGEHISSRGNQVLINGRVLREPWLPRNDQLGQPIEPQVIPKGEYFVMGDNRADSLDSRSFGPIPASLIVGRVVARVWPLSAFRFFSFP